MSTPPRIPISKPFFGEEEKAAIAGPLESGWVVQGPRVREFEQLFERYTGAAHAVATTSCTTALHVAVAALGLKPGDEVIVPSFTWVATANVAEFMGARPVFCDIDLDTFNIDPALVEERMGPKTVGLIPVHLFGLCASMEPLLERARSQGLWIIEDAACAFGGRKGGRHAGTFGDMGCFSFHPRKSISTGEGGMITTNRDDLASLARSLRDHGATRSGQDRHHATDGLLFPDYPRLGYNYRMTDLQGALGCVQMGRADWLLTERARVARAYDSALADLSWLRLPRVPEGAVHGYQSYVTLLAPGGGDLTLSDVPVVHELRNRLMSRLEERGISTRPGTHAPVCLEYYTRKYGLRPEDYPRGWIADRCSLSLPVYAGMTDEEISRVVTGLLEEYAALSERARPR